MSKLQNIEYIGLHYPICKFLSENCIFKFFPIHYQIIVQKYILINFAHRCSLQTHTAKEKRHDVIPSNNELNYIIT